MDESRLDKVKERRQARKDADRSFTIDDETLRVRVAVPAEVMFGYANAQAAYADELDAVRQWFAAVEKIAQTANGDGGEEARAKLGPMPQMKTSDEELFHVADETALACLEPESHEVWLRLRSSEHPHPLTYEDVFDLAAYLIARVSEVPTVAPTDSSDGREPTGQPSTDDSSSPAKTLAPST